MMHGQRNIKLKYTRGLYTQKNAETIQ